MFVMNESEFAELADEIHRDWDGRPLDDVVARRAECWERIGQLRGYQHLSRSQQDELERLSAELTVLDEVAGGKQMEIRRAKLDHIRRVASDPANLEGPDSGPNPVGAPAFVRGKLGTRIESPQETIQRAGNPWRDGGGPLTHETAAGYVSRAHSAIEAVSERLTHDGAELLATLLTQRRDTPSLSVRRSADEVHEAAEMILALSSPHYESAMRSVFRSPEVFAGGLGHMVWSDEERQAVHDVMANQLVRSAFAESAGNLGAYALPLQLDPTVILINTGVVGPFRQLARLEVGTSNVWEGISSTGVTSGWVAEGAVVGDSTPTLNQVAVTPYKQASWAFGSFEVMDDTELSTQLPALFADGKTRLENTAFATGTGSGQPWGCVTRAASDASAGALTTAMIYALHGNVPPRFRVGDGARPAWLSNVSIMDAARQLAAFTGANFSIVNDNQADGIPEMLGIDFYEASAMLSGTTGNRELLLGDFSQMIIVDRLPNLVLMEPLVKDTATGRPTAQRGWLQVSRVGSDVTTAGLAYGSNAFAVHTH